MIRSDSCISFLNIAAVLGELRHKMERNYQAQEGVKNTTGAMTDQQITEMYRLEGEEANLHMQVWAMMVHARFMLPHISFNIVEEWMKEAA